MIMNKKLHKLSTVNLSLKKETIKNLSNQELVRAQGGGGGANGPSEEDTYQGAGCRVN
jgi:hypothetical protein